MAAPMLTHHSHFQLLEQKATSWPATGIGPGGERPLDSSTMLLRVFSALEQTNLNGHKRHIHRVLSTILGLGDLAV